MRAVVQRVSRARVEVDKQEIGAISNGVAVLLGVQKEDTDRDVAWLADKIVNLRIFEDEDGAMNRSLSDIDGEMLIISQFTLLADCRKGRRPSWSSAAPPDTAERLYKQFITVVRSYGIDTANGKFQTMMDVSLVNHGPVTILLDSRKTF